MRRFVDQAHDLGLGVILDVVYNHFGPDGCYHHAFSSDYLHKERSGNDWGDALNFDGFQQWTSSRILHLQRWVLDLGIPSGRPAARRDTRDP